VKASRTIHGIEEEFEITPGFMLTRVPNGFPIGFIKSLDELEFVLPGAEVGAGAEPKTVFLLSYHDGCKEHIPKVYLTLEKAIAAIPEGFTKCCTFHEISDQNYHRLFYGHPSNGENGARYYVMEAEAM
jgi:hypothetical protein